MDQTLHALAEPHRRAILDLVRTDERTVGDIASHFEISSPAISQHLKVLREAGLVGERRSGTWRYYRAKPEGLVQLYDYLRSFWIDQLGSLKEAVESDQARSQHCH